MSACRDDWLPIYEAAIIAAGDPEEIAREIDEALIRWYAEHPRT